MIPNSDDVEEALKDTNGIREFEEFKRRCNKYSKRLINSQFSPTQISTFNEIVRNQLLNRNKY